MSKVFAKSSKPEERRETEELKREKDEIEGSNGVLTKSEGAELNGDDQESSSETPDVEATTTQVQPEDMSPEDFLEETMLEDSLSETPNGGATLAEALPSIDLRKISLSCVTERCDRAEVEEKKGKNDEKVQRYTRGIEGYWLCAVTGNVSRE